MRATTYILKLNSRDSLVINTAHTCYDEAQRRHLGLSFLNPESCFVGKQATCLDWQEMCAEPVELHFTLNLPYANTHTTGCGFNSLW
jgi:hypothetical protein